MPVIYWKNLKSSHKVKDVGFRWETGSGLTIYWHGKEAREAQLYLKRRSREK